MADYSWELQLALNYLHEGGFEQARAQCQTILDACPEHAKALQLLGLVESRLGRHGPARTLLEQALALEPDNPSFHFNYGLVLEQLDAGPEALQSYERAIALQPEYLQAHFQRARLLQRR